MPRSRRASDDKLKLWVEWREAKQNFGRSIAPEGLQDSAQGFNPGNHPIKRFALKGREMVKL
jgi:hypothetical protein